MKEIGFRNLVLGEIYKILNSSKLNYVCINGPFYINDDSGDIDILIEKKQHIGVEKKQGVENSLVAKHRSMPQPMFLEQ